MDHNGKIGISIKQFLPSLTIIDYQLMLATANGNKKQPKEIFHLNQTVTPGIIM